MRQRVANARERVERAVARLVSRHSDPKEGEVAELSAAADRLQERMDRL